MQLSNSTVSPDSNLLTLLAPGSSVSGQSTDCSLPDAVTSDAATGFEKFLPEVCAIAPAPVPNDANPGRQNPPIEIVIPRRWPAVMGPVVPPAPMEVFSPACKSSGYAANDQAANNGEADEIEQENQAGDERGTLDFFPRSSPDTTASFGFQDDPLAAKDDQPTGPAPVLEFWNYEVNPAGLPLHLPSNETELVAGVSPFEPTDGPQDGVEGWGELPDPAKGQAIEPAPGRGGNAPETTIGTPDDPLLLRELTTPVNRDRSLRVEIAPDPNTAGSTDEGNDDGGMTDGMPPSREVPVILPTAPLPAPRSPTTEIGEPKPLGDVVPSTSLTESAKPSDQLEVTGEDSNVNFSSAALVAPVEADDLPTESKQGDDADVVARIAANLLPGERWESKANFAARRVKNLTREISPTDMPKKSFIGSALEAVTPHRKALGIDGAKPTPSMFANLLPASLQHPASEYAAEALASLRDVSEALPGFTSERPEALSTARDAVKLVQQAAEQVSSRDQKSVNLQFSVGGAELTVRVELHANEVRTTFRTDSSELRAALSQEWQSVASSSSSGDRGIRIVPAVFTSSDQSTLNSSSGDASHQRNPHAERGESGPSRPAGSRLRGTGAGAASGVSVSAVRSASAPFTSRHLHTLA
jgi:hypothetical protein